MAVVPPRHPEVESQLGLIVVPVDLGRLVSRQLQFAARLSPGSGRHLLLMHVTRTQPEVGTAASRLAALARLVTSARGWRVLARFGSVNDEVLDIVRHEPAGIVVLGQSRVTPGTLAH